MNKSIWFVAKVFLASTGFALLIKYVAPSLAIPATATNALVGILLPTGVVAAVLGWQVWRQQS